MLRKKSLKKYCRSNLVSSQFYGSKPSFRTIYKRRNDTLPVSQLYQDLPTSRSQNNIMAQSYVCSTSPDPGQKQPTQDIRQYAKKIGGRQKVLQSQKSFQNAQRQKIQEQRPSKTIRTPLDSFLKEDQPRQEQNKSKKTIEELYLKIQTFINHNINLLRVQKRNNGLSKWSQLKKAFSIDKQIEEIMNYYNQLKSQIDQNDGQNQTSRDLSKTIEMLEKLLANQCAESQILKMQYYGWKNQRKNTSSFSNKALLSEASRLNRENKPLNLNRDHIGKPRQVSPLASTAIYSYTPPNKDSYLISKKQKAPYLSNRQPFPRSSYSAQYLNYGHIPTYTYKPESVRQSPETPLAIKASTYQQQYKQKHSITRQINFKELDCFKDKFKYVDISFMKYSQKQGLQTQKLKKKLKHYSNDSSIRQCSSLVIPKDISNKSLIRLMDFTPKAGFYKTQARNEFNWPQTFVANENEDPINSQIKDKRLLHLKQTFRNLIIK